MTFHDGTIDIFISCGSVQIYSGNGNECYYKFNSLISGIVFKRFTPLYTCNFMNFIKASGNIAHERLVQKVWAHGSEGMLANWIPNWLDNRWDDGRGLFLCLDLYD